MTEMITLKTLPLATEQEVFDQVARHLLTQKQKSQNFNQNDNMPSGCMYRSGDLKCAAGCLIADDEYVDSMEDNLWGALVNNGIAPSTHCSLIADLQSVHDTCHVEDWAEGLTKVAKDYKLTPQYSRN